MNDSRRRWLLFFAALAVMAGMAGALAYLKAHQRLGKPGLRAEAIPGSVQMKFDLPARVLDFDSTNMPEAAVVLGYLPKDTSFAQRYYFATNGDWTVANIILMGADRTSIHRPDYCLPGQGWQIREQTVVKLPVAGPVGYDLPVGKWLVSKDFSTPEGGKQSVSGIYIFWFVTDGEATADFPTMLKSMLFHLVRHGVLQRWAYVSYFSVCLPGQETARYDRIKSLVAASAPLLQLPVTGAK
jgi:Protein of unknown function (DUF3485)